MREVSRVSTELFGFYSRALSGAIVSFFFWRCKIFLLTRKMFSKKNVKAVNILLKHYLHLALVREVSTSHGEGK